MHLKCSSCWQIKLSKDISILIYRVYQLILFSAPYAKVLVQFLRSRVLFPLIAQAGVDYVQSPSNLDTNKHCSSRFTNENIFTSNRIQQQCSYSLV